MSSPASATRRFAQHQPSEQSTGRIQVITHRQAAFESGLTLLLLFTLSGLVWCYTFVRNLSHRIFGIQVED
ncbi:MAG TPA: hypothetical protein VLI05_00110 [Candidatus Saccharimonadia bacterium]|nr:hypothetical protein [Candidatus Saccharimonadia bacterium]